MKDFAANKKFFVLAILLLLLLAASAFKYFSRNTRSTENAYINATVESVAAQVSGRVIALHIKENQHINQGDALFDLDPKPYAIALEDAQADLAQAKQNARQDSAEIDMAKAQIDQNKIDLANARSINTRDKKLVAQHYLSQQALDDAKTRMQGLHAALAHAQAKLTRAHAAPENTQERGDVLRAQAAIDQAKLNLERTHVTARHDGQINNLTLTTGSMVGIGAPLFAIIEKNSFYIDANFKETQLSGIHAGQVVDIQVDMYPEHPFKGIVESLSGGTGTAFSLLPPQNATGNWVKIAQRVPVRIKILSNDSLHPLRIGATATVTVHLQ